MYKNIIFDLDETLVESFQATNLLFEAIVANNITDTSPLKFREVFRENLLDTMGRFKYEEFINYGIGTYDLFLHPQIDKYIAEDLAHKTKVKVLERTFKELGLEYSAEQLDTIIADFQQFWVDYYTHISGARLVLEQLRSSKYNLFILTNGFLDIQNMKIKQSNLAKYFQRVLVSEEVREGKPSEKPFLYLIEEENLNPAETIMIGDSLNSDYLPAEQIGIYSLLLDRYNVYEQVEQVNIVKSLDEAFEKITSLQL